MSRPPRGTRAEYRWFTTIPTRWMDNDVYGHVNNVTYYSWIDTAIALFLIENGVLDLATSPEVGLVVETGCRYHAPIAFPDIVTCGVRCAKLGTSSIRYEVGIFRNEEELAAAEGHFVHVYVARSEQGRTVPLPARLREAASQRLLAANS
ncbi:acyl-CoA thioesterase [Belnapia sp. T6]|uniref:Acyl-CoA thioesterase n=1 Tax=Belnapia mucosa TaxID=2804532 RepID=A0ABS1UXW8_9PROT|nr:acyl-CoA thioesterase [Belnapia mucosa]MBL6454314.1 acyl-CoA thioesterase [Belnapia mucosa]